ncbi:MAG: GNAT family N-acetyltransferase [Butyricicoccus sp.]|nr:GNAT family N-acetyltransferase [Butyricicoccus sp.]
MKDIKFVEVDHPDLQMLTDELDQFFFERYGEATRKYQKYHDLTKMAGAAVAYVQDAPVACCCWKAMDAVTAEIKRMYVRPTYRGQGKARQVMEAIEQHAAASGCHRAVLETGSDMADAIAAYEHAGYRICPNYGDFVGDPHVTCMEKEISDGTMR